MTYPTNQIPSINPQNIAIATPIGCEYNPRDPNAQDNTFPPGWEWQNTVTKGFFKCISSTIAGAVWDPFAGPSSGDISFLTGNSGGAVTGDAVGNVNILGTSGQISVTGNPATNTLTLALVGGGTAVDSFAPDTGTSPVVPTGAGLVNVKGQSTPNVSGIRVTGALNELDIAMFSPFFGDFTFTESAAGNTETLTVSNSDNTGASASSSAVAITVAGTTQIGDPYVQWNVGSARSYAFGPDTSSSQTLTLTTTNAAGVTPSSGTTIQTIESNGNLTARTGGYFVISSNAGSRNTIGIQNTSAAAGSSATLALNTVAASGDPYILFDPGAGSADACEFGQDASDSYSLVVQVNPSNAGGPMDGTTAWRMTVGAITTGTGCITEPLQPSFFAYLAGSTANNKTGDGTAYTIGTDALTELFDQNGNFNTNGTITFPVTGIYRITATVTLLNIDVTHTSAFLRFTPSAGLTIEGGVLNPGTVKNAANVCTIDFNFVVSQAAASTGIIDVIVTGGAKTIGIYGNAAPATYLCGELIN